MRHTPSYCAGWHAAVAVEEPTGDADAAFLASLKDALVTAIAEAPEAGGIDAALRATASRKDDGVELSVELIPQSGGEPIREARTASLASALPQARAMARDIVKKLSGGPSALTTRPTEAVPPPAPNKAFPGAGPPKPLEGWQLREIEAERRKAEFRRRTVEAIFLPDMVYVGASVVPLGVIGLGSGDGCYSDCVDEDRTPVGWRKSAEGVFSFPLIWVLGAAMVLPASILTTVIYNRAVTFHTNYWATLLGGLVGLSLDIGLCALLYHTTDSAGALIAPTIAGYVILPQLGAVIGARISRKDVSQIRASAPSPAEGVTPPRVSLFPPIPTAFATRDGAAPGLALGGTF